jgi:ATP adenylyltransferase
VTSAAAGNAEPCVFCTALNGDAPDSLVLFRGETALVILNKFPYNNGHLMVAPNRHIGTLAGASSSELSDLIGLTRIAEMVLTEAYNPHGMNVGMNVGRPAGAGILGHLHMHLVPRWDGDTNFMAVIGETRVVPETADQSVIRLKPIFERLAGA